MFYASEAQAGKLVLFFSYIHNDVGIYISILTDNSTSFLILTNSTDNVDCICSALP
jgi:hypothetical protein